MIQNETETFCSAYFHRKVNRSLPKSSPEKERNRLFFQKTIVSYFIFIA